MKFRAFSRIFLFAVLIDILFLSCTNNNIKEEIKTIMGRDLIFPSGFVTDKQYLIINYVDSNGCTSCKLRIHEWLSFIDEFKEEGIDIGTVFISHPSVYSDVCEITSANGNSSVSVIKDSDESWIKRNNLPQGEMFHTFLVDNKKHVMVVGNPIMNDEIKNIMRNLIKKNASKL